MRRILLVRVMAAGLILTGCRNATDLYFREGGITYQNETGEKQHLHLPDSSIVIVSPGTRLELAKGFGKDNRNLSLDGEAWFEIVEGHGEFELHTRDLLTEVLRAGRFHAGANRARPGEEIDLLEGNLRVKKSYRSDTDNEPEILGAGEMVMINRDIDLMEKEQLNAAELEKLKQGWR